MPVALHELQGLSFLLPCNNNFLYLACPRIFIKTIFNTIFGKLASNNLKFFSNQLKAKRDIYENFLIEFLKILKKKYNISAFIGFNYEFKGEIELAKASKKLKIPFKPSNLSML